MHNKAEEALVHYRVAHADRTDMLIAVLREITLAYKAERPRDEQLGHDRNAAGERCRSDSGAVYRPRCGSGKQLFVFLAYVLQRSAQNAIFCSSKASLLVSTTQDHALIDAIALLTGPQRRPQ